MLVTRKSPLTGLEHTMDINISEERLQRWESGQDKRRLQTAFPELTPEEREFIHTGITGEEWDAFIPEEQD